MARRQRKTWVETRALIQRGGVNYLIARSQADDDCPWEFPGGRIGPRESPEAGLRRLCLDKLGTRIDIILGQPPFVHNFGTHSITYRYYFCSIPADDVVPTRYAELRWILKQQLRDYIFDAPTQQVVDWLLEDP